MLFRISSAFFALSILTIASCKSASSGLEETNTGKLGEENKASSDEVVVLNNYEDAHELAKNSKKMLYVYFYEPKASALQQAFEKNVLANSKTFALLKNAVLAKVDKSKTEVDTHSAFYYLENLPGVAALDLVNHDTATYNKVVGVFPLRYFKPAQYAKPSYNPADMNQFATFLTLPYGTVTQRSLIFAVRIHPKRPQSTASTTSDIFVNAANSHSIHQAKIQLQGHHDWDERFQSLLQQLYAKYRRQYTPSEIVAESWGHEGMFEAAIECVNAWEQSPGHWRSVAGKNHFYGYDMARGQNNIWYCTGLVTSS